MSGWRDHVLQHFAPQTSRLTLVADPDGLLVEEGILNAVRGRGFEVIPFNDPVAFRFAYESQYRQRWDRGENTELVVVLRSEEDDLRSLPYDLLRAGRRLPTLRLAHIFPKLSNPVVQALDRSLLDALYTAYVSYDGGELGDRSTKSFVLRSVFGCAPELAKTPADALRLLCEKHTKGERFPDQLDEHVVEVLRANVALSGWPLEKVVPDRDAFLHWLQDHWPPFVARLSAGDPSRSSSVDVPFHEVRVYVDTLFLDGALRPVPLENIDKLPEWAKVGVVVDAVGSAHRRLAALVERIVSDSPAADAPYKEWQQFAWRWAEVLVLKTQLATALDPPLASQVDALHESVEARFGTWMLSRFGNLANLVERDGRPVMLHHVAPYLVGRRTAAGEERQALLVIDGLAIDQWLVIRDALSVADPTLRMDESGVYAWVPTLTAVSRQTIFAGEIPLLFADSMGTTAKDEKHWRRVWEEADVPSVAIGYRRGLGAVGGPQIDDLIEHPKMQVLGLVINTVDDIMHGMMLGTVGMHQSVKLWAEQGYLARTIERLQSAGFAVYLTSDHGNIEATGRGKLWEGSLVETRGERARTYDSELFREQARRECPEAIIWPGAGLPQETKVLLANGRDAFVLKGERLVAHGGISVEEAIVPFVRLWRE
jgi:hypothetical protein